MKVYAVLGAGLLAVLSACDGYRITETQQDIDVRILDREGRVATASSGRTMPLANKAFLERQQKLAKASQNAISIDKPLILDNTSHSDDGMIVKEDNEDIASVPDTRVGKIASDKEILQGNLRENKNNAEIAARQAAKAEESQAKAKRLITAKKVTYQGIFADVKAEANSDSGRTQNTDVQNGDASLVVVSYPEEQKLAAEAAPAGQQQDKNITLKAKSGTATSATLETNGQKSTSRRMYFVQGGSYKNATSAEKQAAAYRKTNYPVEIRAGRGKPTLFRVLIGPFATRAAADTAMQKLIERGFFDVFVKTE